MRVVLAAIFVLGLTAIAVRSRTSAKERAAVAAIRASGGRVMHAASGNGASRSAADRLTGRSRPIESIEVFAPRLADSLLWDTGILEHPHALRELRAPLSADDLARLAPFRNLRTLDLLGGRVHSDALIHLKKLARLETLAIHSEAPIDDDGLRHVSRLPRLRSLSVCGRGITDVGLAMICRTSTLRELTVTNARITDDGLRHVARLRRLSRLNVAHTAVTDAGLAHLHVLTDLIRLNVDRTDVTDEGVRSLQRNLPLCRLCRKR